MKRLLILLCAAVVLHAQPAERWWEKQPLTILDLHTFADEIQYFSAPEAAARKAALGFNTDTLYIHTLVQGMDDRGFYFRTPLATKQNPDYLGAFLPEARKRGMRTTVYFNVHWFTLAFAKQHPDWLQVTEDGGTLNKLYDSGGTFCVNSPWRDWVLQLMRDLAAYPIDGIFMDGPSFFPETCSCHWCRDKFRKLTGRELPSKRQRKGKGAYDLLEFQANSLAEFLRDSNRVIKSINPGILLYGNSGLLAGNWATARMNRIVGKEQDLLGAEGGYEYNDLNKTPPWKPGLQARLLETQAGGKPTVIIGCPALKPWTHAMLPAAEARLMYADAIANGAGIWLSLTLTEFERPEMQAIVAMNRFAADNARYLHRTRSEAKVAVVWSDATGNAYSPDAQLIDIGTVQSQTTAGNVKSEFGGVSEALLRAHVPFDVVDDVTIEQADLSRYQSIFLPNVACMSDAAARRLTEFVRNGGGLFATFDTSLYNLYGERRPDFALREALGVSFAGAYAGPRNYDFMRAVKDDPLTRRLPRSVILAPAYFARVKTAGATNLIQYLDKRPGPYEIIPPLSSDPALTVNHLGRGTVVYASGDLGNTIANFHMPDSLLVVENAAAKLGHTGPVLTGVPGSVEFVHRSQENGARHLFHLVNFTGEMTRPIREVVPIRGARLTLPAGLSVKRAFTLMSKQTLTPHRNQAGLTELTLPEFHEYEVVVVETR